MDSSVATLDTLSTVLGRRPRSGVAAAPASRRHPRAGRRQRRGERRGRRDGGVTTLMYAAQQGDVDRVERIVREQPFTLRARDRTGKSPLHYCSTSGNARAAHAADYMVMAAPDLVDSRDEDGFTPLHLAVIAGNMQLVTFLLANNADVNALDNEKHTVVHWATVCGETSALRAVLAAGAPVSTPDVHGGYPLHYAAQMCGGERDSSLGLQVLQTLLGHGDVQVSVHDGDKRTPLLWAASAGSARAVLALVRAGAAVEAADRDGLTALHCAASRGHTDCMDTLLTLCGASPDVIDSNGCTALHYAVTLGHADATALLLAHGADANRQDRKGRSPAHCGCAKGQFETVKLIGSHGANLWLRNARGDLPLHDAAASGRRELVRFLLEMRPSQVNSRNNDGRCPLHMAALNDNADMCKILLDAGAHVNPILRTSKNAFMTPLDCALQRGFRSTAKFLQLHGGLPASRIGDPRAQPMNLHIRDDVTLWGDSSSESELEKKQPPKKKLSQKFERKRASVSSNEKDSKKKLESDVESLAGSTKPASTRIDYNNEIVINGRTEINIHQTKDIFVDGDGTAPIEIETVSTVVENQRRPRSAKFGKRSAKSNAKQEIEKATRSTMMSPDQDTPTTRNPSLKDKSTNTSEETVIENTRSIGVPSKEDALPEEEPEVVPTSQTVSTAGKFMQDQISVTSEDVDEQKKDIVVEASVHAPPSSLKGSETPRVEVTVATEPEVLPTVKTQDVEEAPVEVAEVEELAGTVVNDPQPISDEVELTLELVDESKAEPVVAAEESKAVIGKEEPAAPGDGNREEEKGEEEVTQEIQQIEAPEEMEDSKQAEEIIVTKSEPVTGVTSTKESCLPVEGDAAPVVAVEDPVIKDQMVEEETQKEPVKLVRQQSMAEVDEAASTAPTKKPKRTKGEPKKTKKPPVNSSESDEEKVHRSFRVLNEEEAEKLEKTSKIKKRSAIKKQRSRSDDSKPVKEKAKRSKIPTPLSRSNLSKSDRHLDRAHVKNHLEPARVPSLPNVRPVVEPPRCESNMSAPLPTSLYSDNERDSASDPEEKGRSVGKSKRLVKRRSRTRESRSAGSDYESSNLIDSGFEPSPRNTKIPRWKYMSERGVNMTSVTQNIQNNIRRYHLERKIFHHLLELKRHQIRANQHNEAVLVKRAIDEYHRSCASTVGAGRYVAEDFTFKSFEMFLYEALRRLQKNGAEYMKGLPEAPTNPMLCTRSTNRCMHAAHAYTGVPCAAYLPKMDHHSIPKIGFDSITCKPGTGGFLPSIVPKKSVTLELSHGADKQIISLPTDRLDQNKRYYVTFTVKGQEPVPPEDDSNNNTTGAHQHAKSD